MKNTQKVLAVILALMLVLTACGNGGSTESSVSESSAAESSATSSDASTASGDTGAASSSVEQITKVSDANTMVVAITAEQNGSYIDGFGNSAYDVNIKTLVGTYGKDLGLAITYPDENGQYQLNKQVLDGEPKREEVAEGVKYTIKIKDGMLWNDGQKITAADYVFTDLFLSHPAWAKVGADNARSSEVNYGFEDYHNGKSKAFKGVHLIDDHTFSVTIGKEWLPYHFELYYISSKPTPIHRYTPNLQVAETKDGVTLQTKEGYKPTEEDKKELIQFQQNKVDQAKKAVEEAEEGLAKAKLKVEDFPAIKKLLDAADPEAYDKASLTGELNGTKVAGWFDYYEANAKHEQEVATLKEYQENSDKMDPIELLMDKAALEISQVYRFKPDVTCGPYNFVSFENGMAKVTKNDKFFGDAQGRKPQIPNIICQTINPKLDVDYVLNGSVDMATEIIEGEKITKIKEAAEKGEKQYAHYLRYGFGSIPMLCDMGATQYKGVRKAIAFSLDRNEFVQQIAGGYGQVINGYYGIAQPVVANKQDELSSLINYSFNPEEGNKALDQDSPYKFEKDGKTPWDAAKAEEAYKKDKEKFDYWRYDEKGNPLVVYHDATEDNPISDLIIVQIPDNAKHMGLKYVINKVDFATLLTHYYYPDKSSATAPTAFNMGTGFESPFDPYFEFHSSQIGSANTLRVNDKKADETVTAMRQVPGDNEDEWENKFVEFQKWFNDYMPELPLYANDYHDIFSNRIEGYNPTSFQGWALQICGMSLKNE